jgi:hypothetical protein
MGMGNIDAEVRHSLVFSAVMRQNTNEETFD